MEGYKLKSTELTHIQYPAEKSKLRWIDYQEMQAWNDLEEKFWKRFQELPGTYPRSPLQKLGTGLYDQLKKKNQSMQTLTLRYFSVVLKSEDIPSSPMMGTLFSGAARYCREKGYGTSFSMDEIFGFKIDNTDTFRVIQTKMNGQDYFGKNPGENELRKALINGNVVEVFFIEDIKSIMK